MEVAPEVTELELLAQRVAVPIGLALKRAGVAHTTYGRWKHGTEPLARSLRKVRAAITELANEQR